MTPPHLPPPPSRAAGGDDNEEQERRRRWPEGGRSLFALPPPQSKWVCTNAALHRRNWGQAGLQERSCSAEESEERIH